MKTILSMIVLAAALTACIRPEGPKPTMQMQEGTPAVSVQAPSRIVVTRVGWFEDDIAYGDKRGVYIIRDTESGTEYIGVSGVGISETGRHQSGKVSVGDER